MKYEQRCALCVRSGCRPVSGPATRSRRSGRFSEPGLKVGTGCEFASCEEDMYRPHDRNGEAWAKRKEKVTRNWIRKRKRNECSCTLNGKGEGMFSRNEENNCCKVQAKLKFCVG